MRLQQSASFNPGSETDFDIFPASPAVFAIFPDDQPGLASQPYLSQTRDLRRRLRRLLAPPESVSRRLNLRQMARRIEWQCVGSNFEAQWLLFLLNRFYYPRHFRRRLRLKWPVLVKINLRNRFPRCYLTRRILQDDSLYYGPFPSRAVAERFTGEFLDLFKIRRCVPDLDPDPSHPGCIYSQMHMCLAPCFKGCTDEEYQRELARVIGFLNSDGETLARELEAERNQASEALEFEQAARAHRRLEKAREAQRLKPDLVREIGQLNAVMILPGGEKSVTFFRIVRGELHGPSRLPFEENVSSPKPLDEKIAELLADLAEKPSSGAGALTEPAREKARIPPWEHLSLVARWYYSSFRVGELLMLPSNQEIPHARLVRLCRKLLAEAQHEVP